MKNVLVALALTGAMLRGVPAMAGELSGHIINASGVCVWFTIDTASAWTKFHNQRAGFIKPYQSETWAFNSAPEIKFRAEPRSSADCSSARSADISIVTEHGKHKAQLSGKPGAFRFTYVN